MERIQGAQEGYRGHGKDPGVMERIRGAREGSRQHKKDKGAWEGFREREKATHVRKYLVCVVTVS